MTLSASAPSGALERTVIGDKGNTMKRDTVRRALPLIKETPDADDD